MRTPRQEIVQQPNSCETARDLLASEGEDVGCWEPGNKQRKWFLGIKGKSPRQHTAQEIIAFPTKVLRGLVGPSFVHNQKAFTDSQAVRILGDTFYGQHSQNAL